MWRAPTANVLVKRRDEDRAGVQSSFTCDRRMSCDVRRDDCDARRVASAMWRVA